MPISYDPAKHDIDEVLVWTDIWATAHLWAETNEDGSARWLNFKLVEHQSQPLDDSTDSGIDYPLDEHTRPGHTTTDPRASVDHFAEGHIKWDGCMEVAIDRHCCGSRVWRQSVEAMNRVIAFARDELGFEELE